MPTSTAEDYLERIYSLIQEKGYARVSDIAEALQVRPSTVTRMVQKLDEQNLLEYERYRGLIPYPRGRAGRPFDSPPAQGPRRFSTLARGKRPGHGRKGYRRNRAPLELKYTRAPDPTR